MWSFELEARFRRNIIVPGLVRDQMPMKPLAAWRTLSIELQRFEIRDMKARKEVCRDGKVKVK